MARKRMRSRADALAKPAASARAVQHAAPAKEHREAAVAAQRRASEKKPRLEKIRGLESELLAQGSSKANNLVELLESLRSEDTVVAKAALHSLRRLFTCGCAALDAAMRPAAAAAAAADADEADAPDAAAKAANIYDTWIRDRYADYKQDLLARLAGTAKELQTVSMVVMLQLAKQESAAPGGDGLAVGTLTQVLRTLLLRTSHNADAVLKMFVRNFASEYDDVRFHVLKAAKAVLGGLRQQSTDSEALEAVHRALTLLLSVRIPEATRERLDNFWFSLEGETSDQGPKKKQKTTSEPRGKRVTQVRSHRKAFADCWMELLQIRGLDVASYRRVLLGMHDQILPHLPHPLLLSDFLTDAYNHGGAVSMLAMHGLFILMAKHGLEYPQFYPRLYALMTPSIFHLAHRDQFFRLTDLFLTSKGLPVYIVAAFIKRMAQLALTAPPAGCMLLLPVIYNLLQRHPTCKCMIHRERKRVLDGSEAADGGVDPPQTASSSTTVSNPDRGSNDPFVAEENDPARANALGSSLWELEALKRHSFPPVAKLVKVFSADFTKPKYNIDDFTDNTYASLFTDETARMFKSVPLDHAAGGDLFDGGAALPGWQ